MTKQQSMVLIVAGFFVAAFCVPVAMILLVSGLSAAQVAESKPVAHSDRKREVAKEVVTMENFGRVRIGMTDHEVFSILGRDYELNAESGSGGIRTQVLTWHAAGISGGNCNVILQNRRVVSKAQFGLHG